MNNLRNGLYGTALVLAAVCQDHDLCASAWRGLHGAGHHVVRNGSARQVQRNDRQCHPCKTQTDSREPAR